MIQSVYDVEKEKQCDIDNVQIHMSLPKQVGALAARICFNDMRTE